MSSRSGQISLWLAFSILLLSSGLASHVMTIPIVLGIAGRSSWVADLIAAVIFIIWIFLLIGVLKHLRKKNIVHWIEQELGTAVAWIFRISASILLYAIGCYTLLNTSSWAVTTYMQQTPYLLIVIAGAFVSALAACRGLASIAMTSSILLPIVILLGFFVMSANTKYKNYSLLLPILEEGWTPVIHGAFYSLAGLLEIWVLLLFQHKIHSRIRWWQLVLLGMLLIVMTLGPTIGAITEFGPHEAAKQNDTAFEQWKILRIGQLFQHVDFLSIYQWLSGSFARVALSLCLIPDLLNIRRPVKRYWTIIAITASMCGLALPRMKDEQALFYLQHIQFPVSIGFVILITLLLAVTVLVSQHRNNTGKENRSYENASQGGAE